jgi:AcrR family transcriptional regulator
MQTRVRLPRAQRREQIVRTAAAAFLVGGYDKTSMDDIARAAGVTRLIVYRIFESKEALYTAVLMAVLDDLATTFDAGGEHAPAHGESVASLLLAVARRRPDGFRLLWRHTSNQPEFVELFEIFKAGATDYAVTLLAPQIRDGTIQRWAAASLVSHMHESICLWLDDGDAARDEQFLRMLTGGVRAMVAVWIDALGAPGVDGAP